MLHLAQPQVLDQGVDPALGVPPPGQGPRLPHERVEQDGLPHAHVSCEINVSINQRHSILHFAGRDTENDRINFHSFSIEIHTYCH